MQFNILLEKVFMNLSLVSLKNKLKKNVSWDENISKAVCRWMYLLTKTFVLRLH